APARSGERRRAVRSGAAAGGGNGATAGYTGASGPTWPKGDAARVYGSFASFDEPPIERVTAAGRLHAAASSRCEKARNDQCSTATSPRAYALAKIGFGVKFGNVSPEYPVTTFSTRPPLKKSVPRLERLSI